MHGFRRRFSTDIYSSDFNWVKPEWISVKESRGKNLDEAMGSRQFYNASGYTGEAVRINVWHNALSHDEENLASLYRRRLIRDSMTKNGQTWTHFPEYDARKGASDQYF